MRICNVSIKGVTPYSQPAKIGIGLHSSNELVASLPRDRTVGIPYGYQIRAAGKTVRSQLKHSRLAHSNDGVMNWSVLSAAKTVPIVALLRAVAAHEALKREG